jgi:hypothetical protein
LLAQKKESGGFKCADHVQDYGIGDEIRKNHQGKAAKHDLPQIHALAANEGNKTNRSKTEIADQGYGACFEHVDLSSYMQAMLKQRCSLAVPKKNFSPRQIGTATDKIDIET